MSPVLRAAILLAMVLAARPGPAAESALPEGFVPLFDGETLAGWIVPEGDNGHWRVADKVIDYDGRSQAPGGKDLWTEASFENFVLKVSWRWSGPARKARRPVILPSGEVQGDAEVLDAGDSGIYLRGNSKSQINIWCWPCGSGEIYGYRNDPNMPPEVRRGCTPLKNADRPIGEWNTFEITMAGERVSVALNGELVLDQAHLPGVPKTGRIALQHHGSPIQFRDIAIKVLPAGE